MALDQVCAPGRGRPGSAGVSPLRPPVWCFRELSQPSVVTPASPGPPCRSFLPDSYFPNTETAHVALGVRSTGRPPLSWRVSSQPLRFVPTSALGFVSASFSCYPLTVAQLTVLSTRLSAKTSRRLPSSRPFTGTSNAEPTPHAAEGKRRLPAASAPPESPVPVRPVRPSVFGTKGSPGMQDFCG